MASHQAGARAARSRRGDARFVRIVGIARLERVLGGIVPSAARLAAWLAAGTLLAGAVGPARAEERPRLLMLPVVVHSAEAPEYVRDGLADMLSARFARIGAIEVERIDDPGRATTRVERALDQARKARADYVLFGSFTRFGKGASLDVQCAPVEKEGGQEPLREIFVHSGSIGEIIPDLDELAGKVSRFALGQVVEPSRPDGLGPAAGGASASGGTAASAAELAALRERVESLEASLAKLLGERGAADLDE